MWPACEACGQLDYIENPRAIFAHIEIFSLGGVRNALVSINTAMLEQVACEFGEEALFSIMAHEIGHAMDDLSQFETSQAAELAADVWAGCALAITGRALRPAAEFFVVYTKSGGSESHPMRTMRLQALEAGYDSCR